MIVLLVFLVVFVLAMTFFYLNRDFYSPDEGYQPDGDGPGLDTENPPGVEGSGQNTYEGRTSYQMREFITEFDSGRIESRIEDVIKDVLEKSRDNCKLRRSLFGEGWTVVYIDSVKKCLSEKVMRYLRFRYLRRGDSE